jgi:hypothetical protein
MMENLDGGGTIQSQPIVKEFVKGLPHIFGDDGDLGSVILKKLTKKVDELRYTVDIHKGESWKFMYS